MGSACVIGGVNRPRRREGSRMKIRYGHHAGRELGFVLSVAIAGLLLVTVVAFAPWYGAAAMASTP